MKKTILLFLFFSTIIFNHSIAQDAWNIDLYGQINRGDVRYSGSWFYVDADNVEYALIGAKTGTVAYPLNNPDTLIEAGFIPGPETNWREMTVIGDFAYVTTDNSGTGHGMQVIDLTYLPDSLHLVTTYTETFEKSHMIQKDIYSDSNYVYATGTSTTDGVHILDVSDPANPNEIGLYAPGHYLHDCHVRGDLLFAAAIHETIIDIVDISDKSNPVLIGLVTYDGDNTHSISTTEDLKYLMVADERDGFPARIFNIEDLGNPVEVAQYSANLESLVHNPYINGDFAVISHNTEGLRILDIWDPELPVEVGYYDTWAGDSGGFSGLWSACPYLPSGKIIGGNRHDGLYVWTFNETRAARIYGTVLDSVTQLPIANALVELEPLDTNLLTDFEGKFKYGMLAGNYPIHVSAPGYISKSINISLIEGEGSTFEIELVDENFTPTKEVNGIENFNNFPNPFQDFTIIENPKNAQIKTVNLFNSAGILMKSNFYEQETSILLKREKLNAGIYFYELVDIQGNIIGKGKCVIKN